ncbi:MAG: OadG family transporter subunit [Eubacteriales bacterium]|nr:OadG family transporter subunit [Eubacteriales bacterium]
MKKRTHISALLLCLLLAVSLLAGCRMENPKVIQLTKEEESGLKPAIEQTLVQLEQVPKEQVETAIRNAADAKERSYLQGLLSGWEGAKADLGEFISVDEIEIKTSQYEIAVYADASFSKHPAKVVLKMDEHRKPLSFTISAVLPKGELLTRAALNTLMGLAVVGSTLAFLTIVIAQMKHIGRWSQNKEAAKQAAKTAAQMTTSDQTATAAPAAVIETAAQTETGAENEDEAEIAAVISAAIAAYRSENGGTTDFVVRSVRRRTGKSWKTVM